MRVRLLGGLQSQHKRVMWSVTVSWCMLRRAVPNFRKVVLSRALVKMSICSVGSANPPWGRDAREILLATI
eukprot:5976078-Prymnesium_polylepis.1